LGAAVILAAAAPVEAGNRYVQDNHLRSTESSGC
jgi:hypothetical protein